MKRALVLTLGAGAVAVVRYVGVALHAEGSPVHGWLWDAVNGASGAGMAVLEAVGIWHAWEAWSTAQPSRNRSMLMALIVAMFASLVTMTTPYVFSASQQNQTAKTLAQLAPVALWVWSLAVAAAPLLVMASAGMADTLLKTAQQSHGTAKDSQWVSQAVQGAMNALRPEFTQLADTTAQQVSRLEAQHEDVAGWVESIESRLQALQMQPAVQQPALQHVADATSHAIAAPALQLSSGMTWEAALQHLAECNETPGATRMAQLTGFNKSTASRRLAKGAK